MASPARAAEALRANHDVLGLGNIGVLRFCVIHSASPPASSPSTLDTLTTFNAIRFRGPPHQQSDQSVHLHTDPVHHHVHDPLPIKARRRQNPFAATRAQSESEA